MDNIFSDIPCSACRLDYDETSWVETMTDPTKPSNPECSECGLLETTCDSMPYNCCGQCSHEDKPPIPDFPSNGVPERGTQMRSTEEIAQTIQDRNDFLRDNGIWWTSGELKDLVKQALDQERALGERMRQENEKLKKFHIWVCEAHRDKPFPHDDCGGPGMLKGDADREEISRMKGEIERLKGFKGEQDES